VRRTTSSQSIWHQQKSPQRSAYHADQLPSEYRFILCLRVFAACVVVDSESSPSVGVPNHRIKDGRNKYFAVWNTTYAASVKSASNLLRAIVEK